jgi:hypothetical protein
MGLGAAPPWYCAAGRVEPAHLYTKPSTTPPHARGRDGTTRGSSASQPPVVFRPYLPWVVGAGSGRVPGPKFAAGTAAGAAGRFLVHRPGGPETRWVLSQPELEGNRIVLNATKQVPAPQASKIWGRASHQRRRGSKEARREGPLPGPPFPFLCEGQFPQHYKHSDGGALPGPG